MALPCRSKCERVRTSIWNCRPISGVDNAIQWYVIRLSMLCVNLKPKQVIEHIAVTWRSGTIDPRHVNSAGVNNNNSRHRLNTLRPRQSGRHFPDGIFKWIFLDKNVWISINISLKFVPRGPFSNIPTLVQVMAWRRPGDKPLSEPMMVTLPTHICVTRPQWVNTEHPIIRMLWNHLEKNENLVILHATIANSHQRWLLLTIDSNTMNRFDKFGLCIYY